MADRKISDTHPVTWERRHPCLLVISGGATYSRRRMESRFSNNLSLFVSMTCLNRYFQDPSRRSNYEAEVAKVGCRFG